MRMMTAVMMMMMVMMIMIMVVMMMMKKPSESVEFQKPALISASLGMGISDPPFAPGENPP